MFNEIFKIEKDLNQIFKNHSENLDFNAILSESKLRRNEK